MTLETDTQGSDLHTFGQVLDARHDSAARAHAAEAPFKIDDVNDFQNKVEQDMIAFYWIVFTSAVVCVMRLVSNLCVSGFIFRTLGCNCTM